MHSKPQGKRKPGTRMPPLDVTASQRWTLCERVQYAIQMVGGILAAERALGIPYRTLANWQSGRAEPSDLQRLRQLSEAAGRPPDWIERGGPIIQRPAGKDSGQPATSSPVLTLNVPASVLVAVFQAICSELPSSEVEKLHHVTADLLRARNDGVK